MASDSWGFLWTIPQWGLSYLLVLMDEHFRFPEVEIGHYWKARENIFGSWIPN
jgi:hypothetical protein